MENFKNIKEQLFQKFKIEVEELRDKNEFWLKRLGKLNNAESTEFQDILTQINANNTLINQGLGKIQALNIITLELQN
tara:strand:- start:46 stop:279 length:234 start_codon:yes stop_codon:yes gene_type:complete